MTFRIRRARRARTADRASARNSSSRTNIAASSPVDRQERGGRADGVRRRLVGGRGLEIDVAGHHEAMAADVEPLALDLDLGAEPDALDGPRWRWNAASLPCRETKDRAGRPGAGTATPPRPSDG